MPFEGSLWINQKGVTERWGQSGPCSGKLAG